jgi:hypothetical protein
MHMLEYLSLDVKEGFRLSVSGEYSIKTLIHLQIGQDGFRAAMERCKGG